MKYWVISSILLLALGAAWIGLSAPEGGSASQGLQYAPQKGFSAPEFALPDRSGKTIRLSDLRGKAVVLNFWASWCPPCKAEMPALQAVSQAYPPGQVIILGVNSAYQDSESDSLAFLTANGLTFPVVYDRTAEVSHLYDVRSLPTTFFIGPDGRIRDVVLGGPMSEALLRVEIGALLEGVK